MIMSVSYLVNQFMVDLTLILSIAFYTLMERKVLSYSQSRKGPNKVSMSGYAQPLPDAMKLLTKKEFVLTFSNNFLYWSPPFYSFFLFILLLNLIPMKNNVNEINMSWMIFFCFIALLSFSPIVMGWASNSKYTMIGSLRALSQSVSYEVILIMSLILFLLLLSSFSNMNIFESKPFVVVLMLTLWFMLIISLICEVNRAPFDLAEGESELVSGFNTEYGMTKFSMIFLTEYGMMIFMSMAMIMCLNSYFQMGFFIKLLMAMFVFIWSRASYPRIRYDLLMYFTWKNILPTLILLSIFYIMIL